MEHLQAWKRGSIRIGAPTNLLAALASFIPVIWLCSTYDIWPEASSVLAAWGLVALSFGAFYIVEPVSYYAALGMSGTYLSFMSGNIGNMRVPCAAIALDVTESETGTMQAEIVSTMAICGSIITNLAFTTLAAVVGTAVVAVLPEFITSALTNYAGAAIFGGTFGNFAIKYPKIALVALLIPFTLKMVLAPAAWILIVASVFGSLLFARFCYVADQKKAGTAS